MTLAMKAITQGSLEQWDYVLRRLFVLRSTSLEKAIPSERIQFHTDLFTNQYPYF